MQTLMRKFLEPPQDERKRKKELMFLFSIGTFSFALLFLGLLSTEFTRSLSLYIVGVGTAFVMMGIGGLVYERQRNLAVLLRLGACFLAVISLVASVAATVLGTLI